MVILLFDIAKGQQWGTVLKSGNWVANEKQEIDY